MRQDESALRAGESAALQARPIPLSHVIAVFIGNGLEFYNFLSYALFSVYIGKAFFPVHDASVSTMISLATFGIGFVTRPLGAIVLGSLGDRIGRKPAMLISFVLMGAGMLGLALTPTYATIGIAAPILVVLFRLVQGFALGGEVGPTTAYMIEAAPPRRRGLYGSMQYATQDASSLIAALIAVTLSALLTADQMQSWGWRITFLIGVIIVPFGLYLRNRLPETMHAADDAALAPDATTGTLTLTRRQHLRPHLRVIVCGLMLLASGTIGSYVLTYMTTYSLQTLHMAAGVSFGVTVVTAGAAVLFEPISGALSDRFGRKPIILGGYVATLVSVLPVFWAINRFPSAITLYAGMAYIAMLFAIATPPVIVGLTEALPKRIRSGAVATIYALAISVFGGTTQFAINWLIRITHNPLAPAWYWLSALVLGLVAALALHESAPAKARGFAVRAGLQTA
jgi:MHS family citrate/tricarballylate:H+ symporter-like MFS transporter